MLVPPIVPEPGAACLPISRPTKALASLLGIQHYEFDILVALHIPARHANSPAEPVAISEAPAPGDFVAHRISARHCLPAVLHPLVFSC